MFADDQLGYAFELCLRVIDLVAIDKQNQVGVLFNGAAVTQVSIDRAFVRTLFWNAVELGERNNRAFHFLGQSFQGTCDCADFIGPVFLVGADHQLQIIDHDQGWVAVTPSRPPCFCTQRSGGQTCRIIDDQSFTVLVDSVHSSGQFGPVILF